MTLYAAASATMAPPPAARALPLPPLAEATLVPLGPRLVAVLFDRRDAGTATGPARARLSCEVGGRPLPPPFVGTALDLADGRRRHVLLIARGLGDVLDRRVLLRLDGTPAAAVEAGWLQPPVGEAASLVAGLGPQGRRRLLKLLLTTGASLLAAPGAADVARAVRQLLDLCAVESVEAATSAAIGPSRRLLTYPLPPGTGPALPGELVLLSSERAGRAAGAAVLREAGRDGDHLHVGLPGPVPRGAELILLGERPLRLGTGAGRAEPLPAWCARRGAAARAWARGLAQEAVRAGDAPEGLLRELREGAAPAALVVRHLSATGAGVVHAVELRDPDRLVRAVRIERGGRSAEVVAHLRPDGESTLAGVLPLGGDGAGGEPCRVRLLHHSGAARLVHAEVLRPYDGSVPLAFAAAADEAAAAGRADPAEALALAQLALPARPVASAAQAFGPAPRRPRISVVAPLGDDPDVVRARAAMVAREGGAATAEVVCIVAEGPRAAAARRLAAEAAAVFGVRHRVVTVAPEASPSDLLRAGLAHAEGETALWLGPDVLPARAGWLASWTTRLRRSAGSAVLVAPVLDHEGAPDGRGTADCVGFARADLERVLSLSLGHPDPVVLLAAVGARASASPACAGVRYGARAPEDRTAAAVRARALDIVRRGAA